MYYLLCSIVGCRIVCSVICIAGNSAAVLCSSSDYDSWCKLPKTYSHLPRSLLSWCVYFQCCHRQMYTKLDRLSGSGIALHKRVWQKTDYDGSVSVWFLLNCGYN